MSVFLSSCLAAAALAAPPVPSPPPGVSAPVVAAVPAVTTGEDAALEALVAEALAHSPDLEAARQVVEAARQLPAQARALADPMLSLDYTNDGWAPSLGSMPMTTLAVMASQSLPWPGKRDLRGRIAAKGAQEMEQQLARARLGLAADVRRGYLGLLQARALLALGAEQAQLWKQIEGVARARYTVGQGNQQDVVRTQLEQTRVGQILEEQRLAVELRLAELNRLLARPAGTPLETSRELASGPPPEALEAALARLRSLSPELAAAGLAVERAHLQTSLARKASQPDLALQGGYMNRGGLDPMWQAGVAVTLPVRRERRAAAVAEAEARVKAAEARLAATELQLTRRTRERLAQIESAQRLAELYRGGIVPQGRLSVEAALASYETGRLPFVSVLEALTTLYADRAGLVRVLADERRAAVALEEASLEATSEVTGAGGGMGSAPAAMTTAAPAAETTEMGQ